MSRLSTSFVLAYHGCDEKTARNAISRKRLPKPSNEDYDWLGPGIYFWESDPVRALEWAQEKQKRGDIKTPAVIGAAIDLRNCLDLSTRENLHRLRGAYDAFASVRRLSGLPMPKNRSPRGHDEKDGLLRYLDCAVIRHLHMITEDEDPISGFDTVRGMFPEGNDLYPGAGFKEKNHIQIAVRNPDCIKGYFRPPDLELIS